MESSLLRYVVFLYFSIGLTRPCLRTEPGTTPAPSTCASCTADQLDLSAPANEGELVGQETIFVQGPADANGCATASLQCIGDANNVPLMEVNDGIGTNAPENNVVTFNIVCSQAGVWQSQQAPVMTINSAQCFVTTL
ncbi:hypothetical protein WR25_11724 [Diploscapter pachys]|uniref:C6 domain-containing protein n=1 Tax=Diploscapter pachys TaxID=2018661 RepID=A0A2A2KPG3_9BILA|nr:hypothetical protein WR25_11724 [Diploscapter pachys]